MVKLVTTRVGADGVLTLRVLLDKTDAGKLVHVTVETMEAAVDPPAPPIDRETWRRFLERTAGSITDPTFERPPQREYEKREPLS